MTLRLRDDFLIILKLTLVIAQKDRLSLIMYIFIRTIMESLSF